MKLTEKELNEFPIGTKITYQGNEVIKTEFANNKYQNVWYNNKIYNWYDTEQLLTIANNKSTENLIEKVEIPTYTEYIPPKPILDDKEKEYLSSLVKPFKSKVKYITKEKLYCNNSKSKEYIAISCFDSIDSFEMPLFKSSTMYKGMELDKKYTLEELRTIIVDLIIKLSYTKVGRSLWNMKR